MSRGRHRRVVAPPTRLGASEEGDLTAAVPRRAARRAQPADEDSPAQPSADRPRADQPALPLRAGEDTDEAWGQLPPGSDDARLLADRPPHWE